MLREGRFPVTVPALSAAWTERLDFSDQDTYGSYIAYSLEDGQNETIGSGTVLFCAPKHFRFADPKLEAYPDGDGIVVTAKAYARSVEIQCGPDVLLEDNFFDMNAGTRRIRVLRGSADKVSVRSVYDIR